MAAEMDGFEDNTGVVVLAATNRPAALDAALTRPGRFDRIVHLPLPNVEVRRRWRSQICSLLSVLSGPVHYTAQNKTLKQKRTVLV